jgi:electron transfer flavoprotein alpha subunit
MATLIIAEHDNKTLAPATAKLIQAASQIGGEVVALVAGKDCSAPADACAKFKGVSKVLLAQAESLEKQLAEPMADLLVKLSPDYDHILACATTSGKNIMPRLAALLDLAQISEISKVISADEFERPIYAGNAIQHIKSKDSKKIMTVRTAAFAAAEEGGAASVEAIEGEVENDLSQYVSEEITQSDRPELTAARIIISGGRGMQSGDNFVLLEKIADKLGAAIGASRAAVDAGYVPNDYQVGQTGKTVAPELYIAVGISGAIQHLAGMKDSKVIVAINKDEEAPIMQIADYGLIADLFTAVPELEQALTKAGY